MPGPQSGARAALAVAVVAGTALAAVLLRPKGHVLSKGSGPLDGNVPVVLFAGVWLIATLTLYNRYWDLIDYDQELTPVEQRLADVVRLVLLGAAFAVPLLLILMHRFTSSDGPARDGGQRRVRTPPTEHPPPTRPPSKPQHHHGDGFHLGLRPYLIGAAIVLLVLAVAFAGVLLWRYLRQIPPSQDGPGYSSVDDDPEVLADAVDSGRRALRDGSDARAAVIACYAAMERSLAASGIARRASDSPQDLLERAAAGGGLTGPSAGALTALFREARYSTHPMDDGHRDRAAAALADIAGQLASEAEAVAEAEEPAAKTPEVAP